jgi:hypothetical protein
LGEDADEERSAFLSVAANCFITLEKPSPVPVRAKLEQIVMKPDRNCQAKNGDSGFLPYKGS